MHTASAGADIAAAAYPSSVRKLAFAESTAAGIKAAGRAAGTASCCSAVQLD